MATHKALDAAIRKLSKSGAITRADAVLRRWVEGTERGTHAQKVNVGASRVEVDPALQLGWRADVWQTICLLPGTTGKDLIERYVAWYERCWAVNRLDPYGRLELYYRRQYDRDRRSADRAHTTAPKRKRVPIPQVDEVEEAEARFRRLDQRAGYKEGLVRFAVLWSAKCEGEKK